ncbi:MAG TPA: hypothetical protein DC054_20095 [Blastocatellia bacterium]|nr:hypothetical protein [Blastocatellia bacterium]
MLRRRSFFVVITRARLGDLVASVLTLSYFVVFFAGFAPLREVSYGRVISRKGARLRKAQTRTLPHTECSLRSGRSLPIL